METNFGYNLFSLYNPYNFDPIFQIDANLGVPGAVMVRYPLGTMEEVLTTSFIRTRFCKPLILLTHHLLW